MTRPYASDARSTVVERPPGRLGKPDCSTQAPRLPSPPEQCAMIVVANRHRGAWASSTSTRGWRLEGGAAK